MVFTSTSKAQFEPASTENRPASAGKSPAAQCGRSESTLGGITTRDYPCRTISQSCPRAKTPAQDSAAFGAAKNVKQSIRFPDRCALARVNHLAVFEADHPLQLSGSQHQKRCGNLSRVGFTVPYVYHKRATSDQPVPGRTPWVLWR